MSYTPVDFCIAGSIAAVIAIVELQSSLTKPLTLHGNAIGWLALRLLMEAGTSVICLQVVIPLVDNGKPWFSGIGSALVAGFGGPILFRVQLATFRGGKEAGALGFGRIYQRMRKAIDSSLDDVGAVAQSSWLTHVAMPALQSIEVNDFAESVKMYVQTLDRMPEGEKKKHVAFVEKIALDNCSDSEKKRAIMQRVLDCGGRRLIKHMVSKQVSV